jgi:hypothetical protein
MAEHTHRGSGVPQSGMLEDAVGAWLVGSAEREEMTQNLKVEI